MRMRFCGHTMGTPNYDAIQAMRLLKDIGCDGIEFRCADNGHINTETLSPERAKEIAGAAREIGIEVACLTPYYQDYVRADARPKSIAGMKRAVEAAAALSCPLVRAYGGILPPAGVTREAAWQAAVSAVQEIGRFAAPRGVSLCVENHIGTLTMSAADTVQFVRDVGLVNVGILFDYAWVYVAGHESAAHAVEMMRPHLLHAHVKDWIFPEPTLDKRQACLMGEGAIDWRTVLLLLDRAGYEGYLCVEYEKHWVPSLPDASIGMLQYVQTMKEYLRSRMGT
jgi:L-ribulose-5-phosphate 3-epimerase